MSDETNNPHEARTRAGQITEEAAAAALGFPVQNWEKYRFVSFIGEGGMGRVYKALDPRLNRHVALKFIRGDDPAALGRFTREARAQARVEHEHVCKVYETGDVEGRMYIAMQYIDGLTLSALRDQLTLEQKVKLLKEAAEGIQAAHRLGLIHRDIKPGNIMVEKTEEGWHPYVLDFGLARETQAAGITVSGAAGASMGGHQPDGSAC
jgi:serine/threonine-protein kinase